MISGVVLVSGGKFLFHPLCSPLRSFPRLGDTGRVSHVSQEEAGWDEERREEAGVLECMHRCRYWRCLPNKRIHFWDFGIFEILGVVVDLWWWCMFLLEFEVIDAGMYNISDVEKMYFNVGLI